MSLGDRNVLLNEISSHIDSCLVGLDENIGQLQKLFARFSEIGQGESIVIYGPRRSGRSTAINNALKSVYELKEIVYLDALSMGSEAKQLNMLLADHGVDNDDVENDKENHIEDRRQSRGRVSKNPKQQSRKQTLPKRVIVVRGADELAARSKQALLYRLLNATRIQPWLVILIVNRQDFVMALEKRIRSRISPKKVQFGPTMEFKTYQQYCRQLLLPIAVKPKWKHVITDIFEEKNIKSLFKCLFQFDPSIARLKSILAMWMDNVLSQDSWGEANHWIECLDNAIKSSLENEHHALPNLVALSTRAHALLLCILRRSRHQSEAITISYSRIVTDYKLICNTVDNRTEVANDVEVYKELDQLCDMRLIEVSVEKGCTNLAYKRAVLSCWPDALEKALESCDLPMTIKEWAKSQPSN